MILFLFVCKGVIGLCLLLYGFVKFFISGRVIGKVFNLFKCFMNELGLCFYWVLLCVCVYGGGGVIKML